MARLICYILNSVLTNSIYVVVTATTLAACSSHSERPVRIANATPTTANAATSDASTASPRTTTEPALTASASMQGSATAAVPAAATPPDAAPPPKATSPAPPAKPDDFVDISLIIPDAVIAMRYAIADNFVGRIIYPVNRCLLRRTVATQLAAAATTLRAEQRRLWLWDCYRPASIQKEFWKLMPDPRYVAKPTFATDGTPRSGSRHSRGAAVDIGLANQAGNYCQCHQPTTNFRAAPTAASQRAVRPPPTIHS